MHACTSVYMYVCVCVDIYRHMKNIHMRISDTGTVLPPWARVRMRWAMAEETAMASLLEARRWNPTIFLCWHTIDFTLAECVVCTKGEGSESWLPRGVRVQYSGGLFMCTCGSEGAPHQRLVTTGCEAMFAFWAGR